MSTPTRRDFVLGSAAVALATAVPSNVFAASASKIKVGVVGCGGRGRSAALDACTADPDVEIIAMGDMWADRVGEAMKTLTDRVPKQVNVPRDRQFSGWKAYEQVIATDCDYVILATPPAFRPMHLEAAIKAKKHVFMEKPIAVDAPGVRSVLASSETAKANKLSIVAGTQRRHELAYRETMKRIHDGQMGEVVACYAYWNQGGLWQVTRTPQMSDMEWQLRNWLYFAWLSGDHIVEQHIHNLDVCNWAMRGYPVKAVSLAGRQVRTDAAYGHIFDHFATEYEYESGAKMLSMCRQIDGTSSRVAEHLVGTKGSSNANTWIKGENTWRWEGERPNPYVLEHKALIDSIRGGKAINDGESVAKSTLTAIMGRMAGYSGQEVTWDDALKSDVSLMPSKLEFGKLEVPPVAVPGKTQAV